MDRRRAAALGAAIVTSLHLAVVELRGGLLTRPLATWDEAIYANVASNVLDGHWLFTRFTLEGHPLDLGTPIFLEKPPLMMWLQAVSMAIVGETPLGARLPTVGATIALSATIAWFVASETEWYVGLVAGSVVLSFGGMTLSHGALSGDTDVLLTLFGSLFVFGVYRLLGDASTGRRLPVLTGAAMGLAALTKGVAVVPFVVVAGVVVVASERLPTRREAGVVLGAAGAVALPWHLVALALAPDLFVRQYLLTQVVARATGEMYVEQPATFGFMRYPYLRALPAILGALTVPLIVGLLVAAHDLWHEQRYRLGVTMVAWFATFPLLYAVGGGNHWWYVLPIVVPTAVLSALPLLYVVERVSRSAWSVQ